MKIVFLTNRNRRSAGILRAFARNDIEVDAIVIESPDEPEVSLLNALSRKSRTLVRYVKEARYERITERISENLNVLKMKLKPAPTPWKLEEYYHLFSSRVRVVENFNDENTANILRALEPDLIVVGGARILTERIISIPKTGTLNAHPGLLPAYRGEDTMRWAILNGDPIGVTVHFIDRGVDTGEIVLQERIEIAADDSIESLSAKADGLAGTLMVRAIKIVRNEKAKPVPQSKDEGKQYFRMPRRYRKATTRRLRQMQKALSPAS
ncbi:MAG: formyl transferase [Planctomycetota bacterium]|jgi:methionyl-tRNA formyltransferase